jgi:carotenoid cleavage dioxygenase-like enzyme
MTQSSSTSLSAATGFTSQREELTEAALPVTGELPAWLRGSLFRVTPAEFEPGGIPVRHWFDGLAMLHAFAIDGGRVRYTNKFLRTRAAAKARKGRPMRGFATDPCKGIFRKFATGITDNANVNLVKLGERWASLSEINEAIEFDPSSLETLGPIPWAPARAVGSAHPHYDPVRRGAITYAIRFGKRSSYQLYAIPDDALEHRAIASIPVARPAYMHSFAMTDRYAVLFDTPFNVEPLQLLLRKRSFIESYEWRPQEGSRFIVVDLADGSVVAKVEAEAFFTFHVVNAYQEGRELVVDLCGYDDPSVIDQIFLDRLHSGTVPAWSKLRRYRLPLGGGEAKRDDVVGLELELPRINDSKANGKPYRYAYGVGAHGQQLFDRIIKVDLATGDFAQWRQNGGYPGEPVFVARPGATDEDDGVLLTVSLNAKTARSELAVIDAKTLATLAHAEAPHHVPFGFHGQFDRG